MHQIVHHLDDLRAVVGGSGVRGVFSATSAALIGATHHDERALSIRYLEQVQQYILNNLHDSSLSVEKIAKSQRISVRYLHKLFENTDSSVSGYISRLRLSRCKEALVDPRNRGIHVMEIANLWGYADASVFSRSFRREYGISPTQFRLQKQTEER